MQIIVMMSPLYLAPQHWHHSVIIGIDIMALLPVSAETKEAFN